jgi:Tol biopolymer transport system component
MGGIWRKDLTTGEERQLRRDPFFALPPAASADGTVLVISRWAGRSQRIGRVDPATGQFTSLPGRDMAQPALNAAGSRLLFVRQGQVFVREISGGEDRQVTAGPLWFAHPMWLPGDREAIVCGGSDEKHITRIGRLNLSGGEVCWLAEGLQNASSPTVSADGRRLCFVATGRRPSEGGVYALEL